MMHGYTTTAAATGAATTTTAAPSNAYIEAVCGHYYPEEDPKECVASFISCEAKSECGERDENGSINNLLPCVKDDDFMTCNVIEFSVVGCQRKLPVAEWGECLA